jgi:hypothetical protein
MNLHTIITQFHDWLDTVPPDFLFLMLLPLVVAAAGISVLGKSASKLERYGVPAGLGAAVAAVAVAAA